MNSLAISLTSTVCSFLFFWIYSGLFGCVSIYLQFYIHRKVTKPPLSQTCHSWSITYGQGGPYTTTSGIHKDLTWSLHPDIFLLYTAISTFSLKKKKTNKIAFHYLLQKIFIIMYSLIVHSYTFYFWIYKNHLPHEIKTPSKARTMS
jgi:hypothetical protein